MEKIIKKNLYWIRSFQKNIIYVCVLLLCANSAYADDFNGAWLGTWTSYGNTSGSLGVDITQVNSSVSGFLDVGGTDCGNFYNLPMTGDVSGGLITIEASAICPDDSSYNALRYTDGELSNNKITGTYTLYSDGLLWDRGIFALVRGVNTIDASSGSGGSISPTGEVLVSNGKSQTFAVRPDAGYVVSDVRVNGTSVGAVGSYTFEGVTQNYSISATFKNEVGGGLPWLMLLLDDE